MVVNCADVWQEVSNYVDGEVDPSLRQAIEDHVRGCKHCTAVLDGTRNVIRLYGDERFVELPVGFSQRLKLKLESQNSRSGAGRKMAWGTWALAAAAAILLFGGLWIMQSGNPSMPEKSILAKPGKNIPPDLLVAVSGDSRVFHVPQCGLIEGKKDLKTMKAGEAIQKGLVPCVQCLRQYLSRMQRGEHRHLVDVSEAQEPGGKLPNGGSAESRASSVRE
jgi:Putative zinc-finger